MERKGSSKKAEVDRSIDNSAKTLLANIRFMSVDNPIRTVVITSAIPNEGKTFVASRLAMAMASSGMRTLIVECDMRRRSMARELGVHATHGIYSVMSGEVPLSEALVHVSSRLDFLDAEPHIPNPSDLLNTHRFAEFVSAVRESYGYVIFDTPPVGTFVDAAVLGSHVDAVFMVVRERFTHHNEILRAAEQLKTANVALAGIVMNFCERQSSEYYYDYYYKEGVDGRERRRRRSASSQTSAFRPIVDTPQQPSVEQAQARAQAQAQAQAAEDAARRAREAAMAAVSAAHAPDTWNNAPDLNGEVTPVGVTPTDGSNSSRNAAVPSIGNTSVFSTDEINARQNAQDISGAASERGARRQR